jgi:hypothetical protein
MATPRMTPRERHLQRTQGLDQGADDDAMKTAYQSSGGPTVRMSREARQSSGGTTANQPSGGSTIRMSREARQSSGGTTSDSPRISMGHQGEPSGDCVPPTASRRNITSRRSRGKKEGFTKDLQSLMTKRTRGRSRDRTYTRQSIGERQRVTAKALPGPQMLSACKSRMQAEMQLRTQDRIAQLLSSPPTERADVRSPEPRSIELRSTFLMRDIPTKKAAPDIRAEMLDIFAIREQYREDCEEALCDGDEFREEAAQNYFDEYNEQMHDVYERYVNGQETNTMQPPPPSKVADSNEPTIPEAGSRFIGVEELPLVYAQSRGQITDAIVPYPSSHSSPVVYTLQSEQK